MTTLSLRQFEAAAQAAADASPLTVVLDDARSTTDRPVGATQAVVANFTSSGQYELAYIARDDEVNGVLEASDGGALENLLAPSLQAAASELGEGVLASPELVSLDSLVLADAKVWALTDVTGDTYAWFSVRPLNAASAIYEPSASSAKRPKTDKVPLKISVVLGRAVMTVSEVEALQSGHVVLLDRNQSEPVEIQANGTTIALGEIGVLGDSYTIRVRDVLAEV